MAVKDLQDNSEKIITLLLERQPNLLQEIDSYKRTPLHILCDSTKEDKYAHPDWKSPCLEERTGFFTLWI